MPDLNACPLPEPLDRSESSAIDRMLNAERIAIVGASDDPTRPSHQIAEYLLAHAKKIVPINPTHETVLGLKCYPSLEAAPKPIDLVNVFRRPNACAEVARQAISVGAKGIWLQSGIINEDARQLALAAQIDFVQNQCIMVHHMRRGR